jgi:hypothetical protein
LLAVLVVASGVTAAAFSRASGSTAGPEGVAISRVANLASASTTHSGSIVDGIACDTIAKEVVKYHIHTHVVIYVNGHPERLPGGIGITKPALVDKYATGNFYDVGIYDCLYWLHTHVADGIIHVESPTKQTFTLGQFFDIWRQPLGPSQVGPARGSVVVFENGKRIGGNPRSTPLLNQGNIQIDVGTPVVAYHAFSFHVTGFCGQGTNGCSGTKG